MPERPHSSVQEQVAESLSSAAQLFVDQMARKLLVDWCYATIQSDGLYNPLQVAHEIETYKDGVVENPVPNVFLRHAIDKGWVSKDGTKILASGWQTAARFLKR